MYFEHGWDPAWKIVANGSVDLGVPLRTVQLHLGYQGALENVAILHPVLSMTSNVYFRQPPLGSINSIIFGPLSNETWTLLFSCWFLCLLGCCTIHHFSDTSTSTADAERFSYSDLIIWAVAVIHGRGTLDFTYLNSIGNKKINIFVVHPQIIQ